VRCRSGSTPLSLAIRFHDGGRNPQYDDVVAYLRSVGAPTGEDLRRLAAHAAFILAKWIFQRARERRRRTRAGELKRSK
jgi:hypothetical protein